MRRPRLLLLALALMAAPLCVAGAQGGLLFQGVTDLELWKTDSASTLLHRTNGKPGVLARADVWAAIEPLRNVVLFGEMSGETGSARDEEGSEIYGKQYGIRWLPSDEFTIEAGKIQQIVGTFSSRQLSFRNPLTSAPDGYGTTYPHGVRIDGSHGPVDYRLGVLSLPLYRPGYVPAPSRTLRPAAGVGFTPFTGLRFGLSGTMGPYLNQDLSSTALNARNWTSYRQRVYAGDLQVSRGYFEGHAEFARSSYDVPYRPVSIQGLMFYVEPKYTFTPRFYMAARYERNDYPFILPVTPTFWVANSVIVQDVEVAGGFRPAASTLLKLSARKDRWSPNANPQAPKDNGYAVVLQWSQVLDFVDLATRRR